MKAVVEYEVDDSFVRGYLAESKDLTLRDLVNAIILEGIDEWALSGVNYNIRKVTM